MRITALLIILFSVSAVARIAVPPIAEYDNCLLFGYIYDYDTREVQQLNVEDQPDEFFRVYRVFSEKIEATAKISEAQISGQDKKLIIYPEGLKEESVSSQNEISYRRKLSAESRKYLNIQIKCK